jgi:hypothetical protein
MGGGNGSRMCTDTIDLQDQDNPSAAQHQKHPSPNGVAPHQAAELHHVTEERHSEEQSLADAWNMSDSLTEEPGAIEEAQANMEHANGTRPEGDEGEAGESEAEAEDDMMDRLSSSPSIDDGGYNVYSSPPVHPTPHSARLRVWPARSSSLSPTPTITPTRGDFNSSDTSSLNSSPFLQTPQHLPMRQAWATQGNAFSTSKAMD